MSNIKNLSIYEKFIDLKNNGIMQNLFKSAKNILDIWLGLPDTYAPLQEIARRKSLRSPTTHLYEAGFSNMTINNSKNRHNRNKRYDKSFIIDYCARI